MEKRRQGGFLIAKLHQMSNRIFAKKLKKYNLDVINPAQGRILSFLWQNDGIPIQELSQITSLEKSTLTSMLDRLERAGLIKRVPCKKDRRRVLIDVTEKGREIEKLYKQVRKEIEEIVLKGFTEAEINAHEEFLARIFNNLLEHEKACGEQNKDNPIYG